LGTAPLLAETITADLSVQEGQKKRKQSQEKNKANHTAGTRRTQIRALMEREGAFGNSKRKENHLLKRRGKRKETHSNKKVLLGKRRESVPLNAERGDREGKVKNPCDYVNIKFAFEKGRKGNLGTYDSRKLGHQGQVMEKGKRERSSKREKGGKRKQDRKNLGKGSFLRDSKNERGEKSQNLFSFSFKVGRGRSYGELNSVREIADPIFTASIISESPLTFTTPLKSKVLRGDGGEVRFDNGGREKR